MRDGRHPALQRATHHDAERQRHKPGAQHFLATATGHLPDDRTIVVERFRDELGDWRVCVLTPFGARVHAPWALAIRGIVSERVGYDIQTVWSDDGIVLTLAVVPAV